MFWKIQNDNRSKARRPNGTKKIDFHVFFCACFVCSFCYVKIIICCHRWCWKRFRNSICWPLCNNERSQSMLLLFFFILFFPAKLRFFAKSNERFWKSNDTHFACFCIDLHRFCLCQETREVEKQKTKKKQCFEAKYSEMYIILVHLLNNTHFDGIRRIKVCADLKFFGTFFLSPHQRLPLHSSNPSYITIWFYYYCQSNLYSPFVYFALSWISFRVRFSLEPMTEKRWIQWRHKTKEPNCERFYRSP